MRRFRTPLIVLSVLFATALAMGCGEGDVASGASVSVYVARPLCQEAQGELTAAGGKAGDLEVRAVCLPEIARGGRGDLAAAGGNARRATEDSAAVAFLEAPGPAAEFTRSIVESANVAWLETNSGSAAMRRVVKALEGRGSSSPRSAVLGQVG